MTAPFLRHNSRALGISVPRFTFDALRPRRRNDSLDIYACSTPSTFSTTATAHLFRHTSPTLQPLLSDGIGVLFALKPSPNWGLRYRAQRSASSYSAPREPDQCSRTEIAKPSPKTDPSSTLRVAARAGNNRMVKMLLDSGADINHVPKGRRHVLAVAARMGNIGLVQLLIERGVDVNHKGVRGSALAEAVRKEHYGICQMLLDNGADINLCFESKDYSTALEAAAAKGTEDMAKILILHDADVNLVSTSGTPLQAAVRGNRERMVKTLLDRGANVNLVSCNGTALGIAASNRNPNMVELLIKRGADTNIIGGIDGTVLASARGRDIIRILLDNGADINHPAARRSPLGQAAYESDCEMIQFLLDNGADVNLVDRDFGSPLFSAVLGHGHDTCILGPCPTRHSFEHSAKVVQMLIDKGADVNLAGEHETVLTLAASRGYSDLARMLLRNGARINHVSGECGSPLAWAAASGVEETVNMLLNHGADINLVGGKYGTALGAAAFHNRGNVVDLLLNNGADINRVGGEYGTPLAAAASRGNVDVTEKLLRRGASFHEGKTD